MIVTVGSLGERTPEPGPLRELQATWPERYVLWNKERELWEVRQKNTLTGKDERVELLFWYDISDEDWEALPAHIRGMGRETLSGYVAVQEPNSLIKRYRPFDYAYVRERKREWQILQREGAKGLVNESADINEARFQKVKRHLAGNMAAGFGEIRRWIPALVSGDPRDRIPLVRGGLEK
jgi:hypothetical protein